jgi:hypothetical protein
MSNVIQLTVPTRIKPTEARISALLASFAKSRRISDDVFWLKENAELLNVLECTGQPVSEDALAVYSEFYENAAKRLQFFPQYYRFLLSLVLDLEDQGMPGNQSEQMVEFAVSQGLVGAELSDLQRAESRRLMARRGVTPRFEPGLDDRLRDFTSRHQTFALPNKKAAYELTHISFYLSEYGRRDPKLSVDSIQSLHFAGLTAFLDQNADLLAEICIALRYAGEEPPRVWLDWLGAQTAGFEVEEGEYVPVQDDYHAFLVCNWHQAVEGAPVFRHALDGGRISIVRRSGGTALREISQVMLGLDEARSGNWGIMRNRMAPYLSEDAQDILETASRSTPRFEAYFEGFARAGVQ